ncbi:uncharacterized protein F4817DRAFT_61412 [Daldinia loculata]|uniref:uncharacterized protein n=1 Tax=Daldinia loculata TaxID=103429 RepID=UPI0020C4CDE2|nr:uncharacterized protein F4817DRAFT_61412 [Daldinia loculata]KAI1648650.1 hypothetical protein F4817DRAFT_61412 [Daldinia loculata]
MPLVSLFLVSVSYSYDCVPSFAFVGYFQRGFYTLPVQDSCNLFQIRLSCCLHKEEVDNDQLNKDPDIVDDVELPTQSFDADRIRVLVEY